VPPLAPEQIDRFVSLGSPHQPPPAGVVDQTRGILTHCSQAFPGAFHSNVAYTTVAGRYVRGAPLTGPGGWRERFAGAGYAQVRGACARGGEEVVAAAAWR